MSRDIPCTQAWVGAETRSGGHADSGGRSRGKSGVRRQPEVSYRETEPAGPRAGSFRRDQKSCSSARAQEGSRLIRPRRAPSHDEATPDFELRGSRSRSSFLYPDPGNRRVARCTSLGVENVLCVGGATDPLRPSVVVLKIRVPKTVQGLRRVKFPGWSNQIDQTVRGSASGFRFRDTNPRDHYIQPTVVHE